MTDDTALKKKKKKKKKKRPAGTIESGSSVAELASKTPGKVLGVDLVAKKEDRTLRKAGRKGQHGKSADAFEKTSEKGHEEPDQQTDALERGGASLKLRTLTGNVGQASGDAPRVGGMGLTPLQTADPSGAPSEPREPAHGALPTPAQVVAVLEKRIKLYRGHYGFKARWRCPHPEVLGNTSPDQTGVPGSHDQHKDANLCLDALYQAGFAVPLAPVETLEAGAEPGLWYPMGTELAEFSRGRERCFNLVAIQRLQGMASKQRRIRIAKLLTEVQPGDLIVGQFVDEEGGPYGLCWLATENLLDTEQVIVAGHADEGGAMLASFPADHFLWAETLQVLRGMRARDDRRADLTLAAPPKVFS